MASSSMYGNVISSDIVSFNGGLDTRGPANAAPNTFTYDRNMVVNNQGLLTYRPGLKRWLPDTVETVYQIYPATYNDTIYYFTADDGRIKYCQEGDTSWTICGSANTQASLTTALTGTNNDLKFTAYDSKTWYGTLGNAITIAYVNAGASKPLAITVSGSAISVQLATNGSSVITSTANDILAAINADATTSKMVVATLAAGNTGAGVVTALTATHLASGANGTNQVTTGIGVITTFIMVEDKLYIANGNDKSAYVDLTTMNVVKFTAVTDPANAPTAAAFGSGLTYATSSGSPNIYTVYYSITFNGAIGNTKNSPILTGYTSIPRTNWAGDNTYGLTITRNNTAPAGATSWNLYVSTSKTGGSIANGDMLLLAGGLDLATTTFPDNRSLQPDLNRGVAPDDNSTECFIATYGNEVNGRIILWGIVGAEDSVRIGGDPGNAMDFTPTNGGYELIMNKGTNFTPTNVIAFRNSQSIPSLTVFFSNTQGISKQAVIERTTVNYGNYSFVVWGSTDQGRYVPACVSPYGAVNLNNDLYFPTVSNVSVLTTRPSSLNLLSVNTISIPISSLYNTILSEQLSKIVGCANDNKIYFSWATNGYSTNSQIGVYDVTDPNNPRWYTMDIASQWIGAISPTNQRAFVYVCKDNHIFRLEDNYVAQDENADGTTTPFPTAANGALTGLNPSHSSYLAIVQVVFYFQQVVGEIDFTVQYTNQQGKTKTKTKQYNNGSYQQSSVGNWSSPGYMFNQALPTTAIKWSSTDVIDSSLIPQKSDVRVAVPINDITNEFTWQVRTNLDNSAFILRSISYEGVVVGVKGDIS